MLIPKNLTVVDLMYCTATAAASAAVANDNSQFCNMHNISCHNWVRDASNDQLENTDMIVM